MSEKHTDTRNNEAAQKKSKIVGIIICTVLAIALIAVILFVWPGIIDCGDKSQSKGAVKADADNTPAVSAAAAKPVTASSVGETIGENPFAGQKVAVGEFVDFGRYEQDGDAATADESVRWLVLDVQGDKALLISKYALTQRPFAEKGESSWETSSLRGWLNGEFLSAAFTESEASYILETVVTADANPDFDTAQGSDTLDRVFILSGAETEAYFFGENEALNKWATGRLTWGAADQYYESVKDVKTFSYTREEWRSKFDKDNTCSVWLRTMGLNTTYAVRTYNDGDLYYAGNKVEGISIGVRPAVWVKIG